MFPSKQRLKQVKQMFYLFFFVFNQKTQDFTTRVSEI